MATTIYNQHTVVKVYHGYGHKHNLTIYGHVCKDKFADKRSYQSNILSNILHLVRLFCVKPVAGAKVQLIWRRQSLTTVSEKDGFYKFEWESEEHVEAGWHPVTVNLLDEQGTVVKSGSGKVFVPHLTQYGFISDIDDTVMVSHSATVFRRLRVLFTKDPQSRKAFEDVVTHYRLLSLAHTTPDVLNPFFYVSSSEWNLYEDLMEFFSHNTLPDGVFLLSQLKRWYELFKTGKTKHEGKLIRVYRILHAFPKQQFILIGDNSQADPAIYKMICDKNPEKIFAVYIRNVVEKNVADATHLLNDIKSKGIFTCLFTNNDEAIRHSIDIGLIIKPGQS